MFSDASSCSPASLFHRRIPHSSAGLAAYYGATLAALSLFTMTMSPTSFLCPTISRFDVSAYNYAKPPVTPTILNLSIVVETFGGSYDKMGNYKKGRILSAILSFRLRCSLGSHWPAWFAMTYINSFFSIVSFGGHSTPIPFLDITLHDC